MPDVRRRAAATSSPASGGRPPTITGSPLLDDVLAWVDCSASRPHDAGDHVIVVGRVLDLGVEQEGKPLLFYRGGFGTFEA